MTSTVLQFGNNTVRLGSTPDASAVAAPLSRLFLLARTERGPVNTPTVVGSLEDFHATFGKGDTTARTDVAAQVIEDYFREVGRASDAVVVRAYEGAQKTSKEVEQVADGDTVTPANLVRLSFEAGSPGKWGDDIVRAVRQDTPGVYTVEVREVKAGFVVRRYPIVGVTATPEGAAKVTGESGGLLRARYTPVADGTPGAVDALNVASGTDADVWLSFTGGADSAQLSAATLEGTLDADSQERTGLWTIRSTEFGGGVLVAPTANTAELNKVKLAWAEATSRFAPIEPSGDITPSAATAEKAALETAPGASYGGYFYPRARVAQSGGAVTKSALGHIAGLYVAAVMREKGFVAAPAGPLALTDVQRAANGRDLLVHEVNATSLQRSGLNTLVQRSNRIELQGLSLIARDALQPATDKVYERLILSTISYDIGPRLGKFNNTYVDAGGVLFNVIIGEIREALRPYYERGLLFGASIEQAFKVVMDFTLNQPADIAKTGRLNVKVSVRISPVGEGIDLELFHVPVSSAL